MTHTKLGFVIANNADVPHTKIVDEEGYTLGNFAGIDPDTVGLVIKLVVAFNHFEALAGAINLLLDANKTATAYDRDVRAAQNKAISIIDAAVADLRAAGAEIVG